MPKSTPEAEGVSSEAILQFIQAAENSPTEMHSFVLLRHGKIIAEGWWSPYRADLKHTLYSTSKSFTSTAAGFALAEHKIQLTDIISFAVIPGLPAFTAARAGCFAGDDAQAGVLKLDFF